MLPSEPVGVAVVQLHFWGGAHQAMAQGMHLYRGYAQQRLVSCLHPELLVAGIINPRSFTNASFFQ